MAALLKILAELLRLKGNQTRLAEALSVTQPTISRWFRGQKPEFEQRERIITLARELGVVDRAAKVEDATVPIVGYVGAGGTLVFSEGQGPFDEAEMPPDDASRSIVAVKVQGTSMAGQLEDGWLVYYEDRHDPPTPALFRKLCVVGLADGRVLVKKLLPGRQEGRFDLYSTSAEVMQDQEVAWAAPVTWIRPV